MSSKKPATPAVKRPTRAMLMEYTALVTRKKALEQEARRLEKEMSDLKESLVAFTEANDNETETCGYRLRLVEGGRYPKWKELYKEELGEEAVNHIIETTPPSIQLEVTLAE